MRARASINRARDDQGNQNVVEFIYFPYSKIYMKSKAGLKYLKSVCKIECCPRDVERGQNCIWQRGEKGRRGVHCSCCTGRNDRCCSSGEGLFLLDSHCPQTIPCWQWQQPMWRSQKHRTELSLVVCTPWQPVLPGVIVVKANHQGAKEKHKPQMLQYRLQWSLAVNVLCDY